MLEDYYNYIKYLNYLGRIYYLYNNPVLYVGYHYILTRKNYTRLKRFRKSYHTVYNSDIDLPIINSDLIQHV